MRAEPERPLALALEVEASVRADHQRQARRPERPTRSCTMVRRLGARPSGATPQPRPPRRPTLRRHRRCSPPQGAPILKPDRPAAPLALGTGEASVGDAPPLPPAAHGQEVAVKPCDIDVGQRGSSAPWVHSARGPAAAARARRPRGRTATPSTSSISSPSRAGGSRRAATGSRPLPAGAAGAGQRRDQRPAIAFVPEGGGAAGAVIAGLRFGLDQQGAAAAGDRRGEAGARDSSSDDQ
jgi:hypothetical protein